MFPWEREREKKNHGSLVSRNFKINIDIARSRLGWARARNSTEPRKDFALIFTQLQICEIKTTKTYMHLSKLGRGIMAIT